MSTRAIDMVCTRPSENTETVSTDDNLSWSQRRTRDRKAKGLCLACDNHAEPNRVNCRECLNKNAKSMKEYTSKRRAKGLCLYGNCPATPEKDKSLCAPHLKDMRLRAKERNADRRAKGLCVSCAEPSPYWQARCPTCRRAKTGKPPQPVMRELRNKEKEEIAKQKLVKKAETLQFLLYYLNFVHDIKTRDIAMQRFYYGRTLQDIAEDYKVTREAIRQREVRAVRILANQAMMNDERDIPISKIKRCINAVE